ncbi:DUF2017 family protein [Kytococcus sedentarius]|uniref:DUF2017 family protein n=1 Tax=Kytococcus sedentarius TaxID=1276 RepID=UPI00195224EB|nr:DUF2017 family protein [Kytococcus sedentarius]QRO88103.1 DUF2017 family protein [Kytococcus sedentarius]
MARAFRWEGDAAVAHLDDVELGVLRESATAVVLLLGGIPGVDERVDPAAGGLRGGDRSDEAPAGEAEDQASVDARFEALTAGLHPTVPGQDGPGESAVPGGLRRISPLDLLNQPGADPALHRLFPEAHPLHADIALEFADVAHAGIRRTKLTNLNALIAACEQAEETGVMALELDAARQVMAAMTDIRIVLADRLGIEEDGDAEQADARTAWLIRQAERGERLDEGEERDLQLGLHHGFLGWMQETLVEALMRR